MKEMKLTFVGGVNDVTGANFLLEIGDKKLIVDCGMLQGGDAYPVNAKPFTYDPASIDVLVVTHAHIDHIGKIPKLVKDGFKGKIISTIYTKELAPIMLEDSCKLISMDAERRGVATLYDISHVQNALSIWETLPYHTKKEILPGVTLEYKDAGHILGSGMAIIEADGRRVAFTGDLGNTPSPILNDTEYITDADYMVMESVYGDRNHPSKEIRRENLLKELKEAIKRGGTILIPMFSLEKTQDFLYEMNYFVESGLLPAIPVFLDSPMAIKVTEVYKRAYKEFNPKAQKQIEDGDDIFSFPKLSVTQSRDESQAVERTAPPKILLAGSGMSAGGRIVDHERVLLPDPKNTIIFLGYQSVGTLGRAISSGLKKVRIGGHDVKVNAKVVTVDGYSSHKDSDHLLDFVEHAVGRMKKVFVAMGESKSALYLAQRINDNTNIKAVHPQPNDTVVLD